jgi:hypothetical protein
MKIIEKSKNFSGGGCMGMIKHNDRILEIWHDDRGWQLTDNGDFYKELPMTAYPSFDALLSALLNFVDSMQ